MTTEERKLEAFLAEAHQRCIMAGWHPTIFDRMKNRYGTVPAITKLMESGTIQTGLDRCVELGLADWSLEKAVIKHPSLFTAATVKCAEWRLKMAKATERGRRR